FPLLSFLLLMLPPPPRSTLFPYTTLFRSHEVLHSLVLRRGIAVLGEPLSDLPLVEPAARNSQCRRQGQLVDVQGEIDGGRFLDVDRKSTRLNSSHRTISYAVFCLKKKKRN